MPAVSNVLVVGGGVAGTAAAIRLADGGVAVDLIEVKPEVGAVGSGITLQGNALRELRRLGVWDEVRAAGYPFDSLGLRAPDPAGTLLAEIPDVRTGGPDLPATLGLPRPALARILLDRAAAAGAKLRLGTRRQLAVRRTAAASTWTFSDGSAGRYDLVVGADGIRSATRRDDRHHRRAPADRHGHLARVRAPARQRDPHRPLLRRPVYIAGYCPTGENSLYAYLVEDAQDRSALTPDERLATMRALAEAYHGPWDEIRATLDRPRNGQLHLVRDAGGGRAVEPRAGRADRRRRPRLPADPGPGRRAGAGGRGRARPSCCSPRTRSTTSCGRRSPPAASSAPRPSSRLPASSASGSSTTSRATCPA